MGAELQKCFNIAFDSSSGEKSSKRHIISFVKLLRKEFKKNGIDIPAQHLADELVIIIKTEKSSQVIKNREKCRKAVGDILFISELMD